MIPKLRNIKPETAFIILAVIYGLSFLMINPPFQAIDEKTHFLRASDVSEGHMMPSQVNGRSLVTITEGMAAVTAKFNDLSIYPYDKLTVGELTAGLDIPINEKFKTSNDISIFAIVTYPPVPYFASALGMDLCKILNLPALMFLYIGRLMNLFVWLLLIYLAIKITPVHKWVMFLLSLMPLTIYQGASLSADSFTIAVSFLVIAIFLKFAFDEAKKSVTKLDLIIIFGLVLMLTLSKPVYFILMFLFFLIPSYKLGNRKKLFSTFAVMFLSIVVIESLWYLATHSLYIPENANTSVHGQLLFIFSNPAFFPYVMGNTLWQNGLGYLTSAVGRLGWDLYLPSWLICSYVAVLIATALLDKSDVKISRKQRFVIAGTFLFIFFMILVVEYVAWTPIGKDHVGGVQGRYFVPVAPLLLLLLYNNKIPRDFKGLNKRWTIFMILFVLLVLSFALFEIINKYYMF